MKKFPVELLPKEKLVDTNGAGAVLLVLRVQMQLCYIFIYVNKSRNGLSCDKHIGQSGLVGE